MQRLRVHDDLNQQGQQQKRARDAASEESGERHERRWLQIGNAGDAVAGRASAGIRRSEADEKTAPDDEDEPFQRQQLMPIEYIGRDKACELSDANGRQRLARRIGNGDRVRVREYESRSEEHTSELQSLRHLVCRLLLEK